MIQYIQFYLFGTIHKHKKQDKAMTIKRDALLNQLIAAKHSDFVKIITGIRRCGKSFLLFKLFRQHLLSSGVKKDGSTPELVENTL